MNRIKLFLATLVMVLTAFTAVAQNITVTGVVSDPDGPLPAAYVTVQGTSRGTVSSADGSYSISVPANGTLIFSSVGYQDAEVPVNGRTQINVTLTLDSEILEETVVIGYGSGQKISNLIGSVATVKSDAIKSAPSSSALDMLQGQVAGLSVLTNGGVAGDNNVSMTLHGVGSLGAGSTPLFIIDGIPSSSSSIQSMNPNDILSISVLKDASATSIYGSRAANGVVYVTTRSGSYNEKASVSIRSQYGISTLADFTMYDNMMSGPELKDFWVRSGIMTYEELQRDYIDHGYDADTKWQYYYQQFNNPQYQNDITIEGGGAKVAYMIGASQFHQRGNTIGNVYDRYTLRSNVQGHPKKWLRVGMNVNLSFSERTANGNWGSGSSVGGNNYLTGGLSMMLNPLYPAIDPVTGKEYEYEYPLWAGALNQKYYFKNSKGITSRYGLIGNTYAEITILPGLKLTTRAGLDGYVSNYDYKRKPSFTRRYPSYTPGRSMSSALSYTATITNTLEYTKEINRDHRFSVLVGQEGIRNNYKYFWGYSAQQTDDRLLTLTDGTQSTYDLDEQQSAYSFLSYLAHADYSFRDKYIFDASFRYDSSSRFGRDNRWAPFWAVGAMWKIKKENFMKEVNWVNDLNLKFSYGTQGNASIGEYGFYALIGSYSGAYDGATGLAVAQPSNYDYGWEQQGLLTATVSGRVFDVLDFDIEFYNRTTDRMLMDVPQPYYSGFTSMTANVGGLRNTGIDVTLGADVLRGKDYFVRLNATFNYNKETVTGLFNGLDQWEIEGTGITYVVGQPVSFYYPIWAGVDPEDGKQMWYVPTGWEAYQASVAAGEPDLSLIDKTKTRKDVTTKEFDEDLLNQNTGYLRHNPVNGGFGIGAGWKGLTLQADFAYVLGKHLINNDAFFYNNPNQFAGYNTSKAVSDYWTENNRYAKYPSWADGTTMQFDTHLIENANFLRLKSLIISYALPKKLLNWSNGVLNDVKISFTGRNLFTITKYMGADPEVNSNLVLGLPGNTKQFLGGIEISF